MTTTKRRIAAVSTATLAAGIGLSLLGALPATAATSHNPFGHVDHVLVGTKGAALNGWAADPDNLKQPLAVHLTVDHNFTVKGTSGVSRPDVQKKLHTGPKQGFVASVTLKPGKHTLCVGAENIGPGKNTLLGCYTITVK